MPLVVVILPKTEKFQQGLSIRVEAQKNSRLIGQCHRCQKYGHAQSYCTASNVPRTRYVASNRTRGAQMCELW
nr:unnamed protein product [Callosobruchus chinensis]